MQIQSVQQSQPRNNNKGLLLASAAGAGVGALSRYILPTKNEAKSIFNQKAVDEFVSSAACSARGAKRSALKYSFVGALLASGVALLYKAFAPKKPVVNDTTFTKLDALIDAPDYACEIMWYED